MARNCKLNTPVEKGITSHTSVYKKILPETIQKEETTIILFLYRVIVQNATNVVNRDALLENVN